MRCVTPQSRWRQAASTMHRLASRTPSPAHHLSAGEGGGEGASFAASGWYPHAPLSHAEKPRGRGQQASAAKTEALLRCFLLTIAAAAALTRVANAATFEIDPTHTEAQFAVRHLMLSTVRGHLGKVTGTVTLDETDVTKSSVEASIDASGIDTREPKRDEHLKGPDFLDVGRHSVITFKSKQVSKAVGGTFRVSGDLTIRGVTKDVVLVAEGSPEPVNDPFGNVKLGGVVRAKINRQDFGVAWSKTLDSGGLVVGNDVDITIDVELSKKK